jgi:hypothetical protein
LHGCAPSALFGRSIHTRHFSFWHTASIRRGAEVRNRPEGRADLVAASSIQANSFGRL